MSELASSPGRLDELLAEHGSPLNVHQLDAFGRNANEIEDAARDFGVQLGIFFARKANKSLAFVEEAGRLGLGVDVASEAELKQTLAAGIEPAKIILTAAIKPRSLLELCVSSGVTVAIDNLQELEVLQDLASRWAGDPVPLALRLNPDRLGWNRPRSRFGLFTDEAVAAATEIAGNGRLLLAGLHFHIDGYAATDRAATLGQALEVADRLAANGNSSVRFIDIGGGFPISYLRERDEWDRFWSEQREAVAGQGEPLTFGGHGLGLRMGVDGVEGTPALYPYWQEPVRGDWLRGILGSDTEVHGRSERVADALRQRQLELRCEPGRALLDGCGVTAARVEFTKPYEDGVKLIGLAMNRTQCRTGSDDFLVDPLLVPGSASSDADHEEPTDGYLVGAYCIERELLSWRRLHFPKGVRRGDIVVFPNTAGYFMHLLESSSHQMPLARNLVLTDRMGAQIDQIDGLAGPV